MNKRRFQLTKKERKLASSKILRWAASQLFNKRSFEVFEKHLDIFEDDFLSREVRESAARKIDRMINWRLKKHEQNK